MSTALPLSIEGTTKFSPVDTHTVYVSNHAALRVYSDTRPRNWKIADLQKGLILIHDGTETVGEGTGFGLPVLVCSDETYFSGTSRVYLLQHRNRWIIRKEFTMDRLARDKFRNIMLENRTARAFLADLANAYQRHSRFRFLTLKKLTREMSIGTTFVEGVPLGIVVVTYTIDGQRIVVKADFKHLKSERIQRIFMLNEQGSRFFRQYIDSQEKKLTDGKIGAWDGIDAEWASLLDPQSGLGFRLWRKDNCVLRRGREFIESSLDWVGLDYEVIPNNGALEYTIEILGV
jgi:hypothetical protein